MSPATIVELHVGRSKRLDVPLKRPQDPSLRFVPCGMVVMHVSTKHRWLALTRSQRLQRRFECVERPVGVDQIVAIQDDCRIVVMRTDPQIVP